MKDVYLNLLIYSENKKISGLVIRPSTLKIDSFDFRISELVALV